MTGLTAFLTRLLTAFANSRLFPSSLFPSVAFPHSSLEPFSWFLAAADSAADVNAIITPPLSRPLSVLSPW